MIKAEPVMIVTFAMAIMHLAIAFGIPITDPQQEAIKNVLETGTLIVVMYFGARNQVTPSVSTPVILLEQPTTPTQILAG